MPNDVEIVVKSSDRTDRGFASVRRQFRNLSRDIKSSVEGKGGEAGAGMGRKFLSFLGATLKPGAVAIATGFSAQLTGQMAAGLATGAVHIAQGFGAALALLPAAALAGGLALGALRLGLLGVGDALKAGLTGDTAKFEEALKGLAPAAQTVAREIVGVKDQFDSLKQSVQERLFGPLIGQVQPLADIYLRQLHLVLGDVAGSLGQAGRQVSGLLRTPQVFRAIFSAMENAGIAVGNLTAGLGNLLRAFLPLVTVGASFLPGLTDGFGGATARLAAFMREAERTGALRDFIQQGIDAIKGLIDSGAQVVRILKNVGAIGKAAFSGLGVPAGGLLDTIERLSEKAREFFETAEGQTALSTIMQLAKKFAEAFLGTLQKIGEIIAPVLPQIVQLLTSFANLKTAILDALAPAVQFVGEVLLPALSSIMDWLANNGPVLQGILIALFTAWAIHAGIAAAATIAATWPLLLVGVAVAALAALIITHWGTIKAATLAVWNFVLGVIRGVWNWISTNWPLLLAILTGPIGVAVLIISRNWGTIKAGATAVKDWIVGKWNALIGFFQGIPGRVTSALSGMWNVIKSSFKSAINTVIGWWNGLSFTLPSIHIPGFDPPGPGPSFGGATIGGQTFSTPNIGYLARGGMRRGLTAVGERGIELMDLPAGSRVHPNANSEAMLRTLGEGGTLTLRIEAGQSQLDRLLVEVLRRAIKADHGGDVQVALGFS